MKIGGRLQRVVAAFKRIDAMVWVGMGIAFLVLGTLRQAKAFMGLGAVLLALGLTAHKRRDTSS